MTVDHVKNPFSLEPVNLLNQFFGRQTETRRVLSFLHCEQCVSVVGPPKIGKTSLLFHVAHPYTREKYKLSREQIFVYIDCKKVWSEPSLALGDCSSGECYILIREAILQELKVTESIALDMRLQLEAAVRAATASGGTAFSSLNTLFRTVQGAGLKLVVVLDHFETLAHNPNLDATFFASLRALPAKYPMVYLVASEISLDLLEETRPEGSPFFNIFPFVRLNKFSLEESRELVVTLLERVGLRWPEFITEYLLELGNNEPYRLQQAGFSAFRVWQEHRGEWHESGRQEIKVWFDRLLVRR
jgi:hypothetical protein